MAYTYDDFLSDAKKENLLDQFSQEDLQRISQDTNYGLSLMGLLRDASTAKTTEAKLIANQAAEQLRKSYGTEASSGSFRYDKEYQLQKLQNEVVNPKEFTYDASTDPVFSAIKKAYLREGERAGQDTLAKVSAATGGVPSSWAVTASQQANNYYGAQLTDQIPTLEQNAYQRYIAERQEKLNALSALNTDRQTQYNTWLDQQELAAQQEQQRLAAEELRIAEAQQKAAAEQAAKQQMYDTAMQIYEATGQIPAEWGLSQEQINSILGVGSGFDANYDVETIAQVREELGIMGTLDAATLNTLILEGKVKEVKGADGIYRYYVVKDEEDPDEDSYDYDMSEDSPPGVFHHGSGNNYNINQ